jgi:hypothetical protein
VDFDEESLKFVNFISILKYKTYTGTWKSQTDDFFGLNTSGKISLKIIDEDLNKIEKFAINKFNYKLILIIQEGEFLDKFMTNFLDLKFKFNLEYANNSILGHAIKGVTGIYNYFKVENVSCKNGHKFSDVYVVWFKNFTNAKQRLRSQTPRQFFN